MVDVMLDLETMGVGPCAAIVAVGAVEFDVERSMIGEKFYSTVDLGSAVRAGGVIDAATVMWWMRQGDDAREAITRGGDEIASALLDYSLWMKGRGPKEELKVWGNGADFDNVILATAYQRLYLDTPWSGRGNRCYRTAKKLFPQIELARVGVHHNAVDDAESQARHLLAIVKHQGVRI